jgi:hypothetical protein
VQGLSVSSSAGGFTDKSRLVQSGLVESSPVELSQVGNPCFIAGLVSEFICGWFH